MNPDFWKTGAVPEKFLETAETEQQFRDKHGENLKKTHPEIFKKGILKKSTRFFKEGDYKRAEATLMSGFKLRSLRQHFEPNFAEMQAKRDAKKEADAKAAKEA